MRPREVETLLIERLRIYERKINGYHYQFIDVYPNIDAFFDDGGVAVKKYFTESEIWEMRDLLWKVRQTVYDCRNDLEKEELLKAIFKLDKKIKKLNK